MPSLPLELDDADRHIVERAVLDFLAGFVAEHREGPPAPGPIDGALTAELLAAPPDEGDAIERVLDRLSRALEPGLDTSSGRFLAYIPSGGVYTAALGTFLAAATNQYTAGAHAAPGLVAIEESVIRWATSVFGLPETAGGVLLSGGSIANLTAVVTARSRFGDDFADGVLYTSDRAHHSIAKAARIAGIAPNRVRMIATDDALRLDVAALEAVIDYDLDAGLRPMLVAATAGTTDTGAIDPLAACADVAARHGAWLHVDGAYGGFFALTERGRERLAGIERADSITVDAHKSLLNPFGVGGLLVRDRAKLVAAHEGRGAYMRDVVDISLPHYLEMGPELTRPSRGLPVWLALQLHGVNAFVDVLDHMLDLTEHAARRLTDIPAIELVNTPSLSVVAFRGPDNDTTQHIQNTLNDSGDVYVSSTTIDVQDYVRLAFLSQRTTQAHVDRAIDLVAEAMA